MVNNEVSSLDAKTVNPEEHKKLDKIVIGEVVRKKNNTGKLMSAFFAEDVGNIKDYLIFDVIVPAIKNVVSDVVENSLSMLLFGDTRRNGKSRSAGTIVSYSDYYNNGRRDKVVNNRSNQRGTWDFDDIVFESRGEAECVLDTMHDIIEQYGSASIADLYELTGQTSNFTDQKYGWVRNTIVDARVERIRGGYVIKFPKAVVI